MYDSIIFLQKRSTEPNQITLICFDFIFKNQSNQIKPNQIKTQLLDEITFNVKDVQTSS